MSNNKIFLTSKALQELAELVEMLDKFAHGEMEAVAVFETPIEFMDEGLYSLQLQGIKGKVSLSPELPDGSYGEDRYVLVLEIGND